METKDWYAETAAYLSACISGNPETAVILGSGLGALADHIEDAMVIPYHEIPHFVRSTASGHKGNFICGKLGGKMILAMQGRFHYYEGYTMEQVTFPIRVMKLLGIRNLLVSNAAGGINTSETIAAEKNIPVKKGVYVGLTGPSYETPAEYAFYGKVGGDAIGMSTVPEVIVARHCGIRVFGMSVITNEGYHFADDFVNDANDVIEAADRAAQKMTTLFASLIARI